MEISGNFQKFPSPHFHFHGNKSAALLVSNEYIPENVGLSLDS